MKKPVFKGSAVAIITPMYEDGRVNYEAFAEIIEDQIKNKSDAIVVCGTTGEASTLVDEEHLATIAFCVKKVAGRVPVIAGTGANDTPHAIRLSKGAQEAGADALLQVTPYYNKTNQSGLIRHFEAVADSVNIPIILYNVPSRTGMSIAPSTYLKLSKHPRIVATKEASGDFSHIATVAALCGEDLAIYSGNDDQVLPILALGGLGVISVVANVAPEYMHNLCETFFEGDFAKSLSLQLGCISLSDALFSDVNPIPVKEAMNLMGYNAGICRLPLGEMEASKKEGLANEMRKMQII